jgi:type I restriction enzyme S subunit
MGILGIHATVNQACCAFAGSKFLDTKFTFYWLWMRRPILTVDSKGGGQPNLSQEDLRSLKIPAPSLTEQRAIAAFLDRETGRIDALIEKKERQIELLEEKRAALISHAVTKGLDPDVPMKDSGVEWLGEIPAHWEIKRLKFVASVQTGFALGRNLEGRETVELPYLRVANVQHGFVDLSDIATVEVGRDEIERYSLQAGDILMTEGGDYDKLGRGTVWEGQIHPCAHQNHVFAVRAHPGTNPYWISLITQANYARHYFILRSKQSTNLASISLTNLIELPVVFPPTEDQGEVLLRVNDETAKLDTLVAKVQKSIDQLREYRTALISAAVTGKIDVRGE